MLAKIGGFVKVNEAEIVLVVAVILVSMLSFSIGYISAMKDMEQPIQIMKQSN
ncbi:MAG: hypothetical protein BWY21_01496 [Parcubacteria group bacterium ADurb.Bin216]|nr:MAG: hypothetical protein BWY21_01496 [Parcubacteria group bacterium ADurb.Bin216]